MNIQQINSNTHFLKEDDDKVMVIVKTTQWCKRIEFFKKVIKKSKMNNLTKYDLVDRLDLNDYKEISFVTKEEFPSINLQMTPELLEALKSDIQKGLNFMTSIAWDIKCLEYNGRLFIGRRYTIELLKKHNINLSTLKRFASYTDYTSVVADVADNGYILTAFNGSRKKTVNGMTTIKEKSSIKVK